MNNAISRLIEAASESPAWFNKLSPEAQERYLSLHPQSSLHGKGGEREEDEKKEKQHPSDEEYDRAFDEHKHGVTEEEKKGQKSHDVVPHKLERDSEGHFKPENRSVERHKDHKKDDDVIDVDFKEIPRGEKKQPKLPNHEKKSEKTEPNKESHKPEKKTEPEKKSEPSKKDTSSDKPKVPHAVERIKKDTEEEKERKSREDRDEERKQEKHDHQMEVLRKKEEERQEDRAEKKRKEAEKEKDKKPEENKKPEDKKEPHKDEGKKSPEKKKSEDEKKKKDGFEFGDSGNSSGGGSSGSHSEPSSEKHKPNSMPNENGEPNPHGKGHGGEGKSDHGGKSSPVTPSGDGNKPLPPKPSPRQPSPPDDTDVNFEDEPSPTPAPKEGKPSPESEKPGPSGSEFTPKSQSQPGNGVSPSDGGPKSKSEAPKVEEKPGRKSESIDVPEAPSAEGPDFQQQDEGNESAPAPEMPEPSADNVSDTGVSDNERAPTPGEPAPEVDEPTSDATKPFKQDQEKAPAVETPKAQDHKDNAKPTDRMREPDEPARDKAPEVSDDDLLREPEDREDQGQQSQGFGAPPSGGMEGHKPGSSGAPSGGPDEGEQPQGGQQDTTQQDVDIPSEHYSPTAPSIPGTQHRVPKPDNESDENKNAVPTAPNSPARVKTAQAVRAQSANIAQRLMKDAGTSHGLKAMFNILEGHGTAQDGRAALNLLSKILGMASSVSGGKIGKATFMAIKHAGVPAMVEIVKRAFNGSKPSINPEHQREDLDRLVKSAADYAQSGSIPARAWQAGVQEVQQGG